ncbi:zinc finger protein 423 [Aphis craccivora]|uniref:Zinc finger protein 423 n=1 Tax=Aphis craccivora TaxID=307492 RepID=A0A6G0VW32_APHCR|nr:zinc finger protein 423 [Aphis craccivora]
MFNCVIYEKVYAHKSDLNRYARVHDGSTNTCGICLKTFTRRDKLSIHIQNCHKIARNTLEFQNAFRITATMSRASVIKWAPPATPQSSYPISSAHLK